MPDSQGYGQSIVDYSNEVSSWSATTEVVTDITLPVLLTDTGDLETALSAIILGTVIRKVQTVYDNTFARVLPTDPNAQRERKWLVVYHDNTTGKIFRVTIPTANPTGVDGSSRARMIPGTDRANLANTQMAAFKTKFETAFRSPDDPTHGITVDNIYLVGRNL